MVIVYFYSFEITINEGIMLFWFLLKFDHRRELRQELNALYYLAMVSLITFKIIDYLNYL
jgi:hypothetical protein